MLNILCYGDSNTYGFIPGSGERYEKDVRWSGRLACLLGDNYSIIEEGCNARTAYFESIDGYKQSGCLYFSECLSKYPSLSWVILAIGINDAQIFYNSSVQTFKDAISQLILTAKKHSVPKVLILSPSVIKNNILNSFFNSMFDEASIEKSKLIANVYESVAKEFGCAFLDLNNIADVSDIDGLHYDAVAHSKIALAVKDVILSS